MEIPEQFDLILMNGVSMYLGQDLPWVLKALTDRLRPGGEFFWDYSFPAHPDLLRSELALGWGLGDPRLLANPQALAALADKVKLHHTPQRGLLHPDADHVVIEPPQVCSWLRLRYGGAFSMVQF